LGIKYDSVSMMSSDELRKHVKLHSSSILFLISDTRSDEVTKFAQELERYCRSELLVTVRDTYRERIMEDLSKRTILHNIGPYIEMLYTSSRENKETIERYIYGGDNRTRKSTVLYTSTKDMVSWILKNSQSEDKDINILPV